MIGSAVRHHKTMSGMSDISKAYKLDDILTIRLCLIADLCYLKVLIYPTTHNFRCIKNLAILV